MDMALSLLSGLCWTVVYIEMIRVGFRDKTYGMPVFALALNIAWECIYAYKGLTSDPGDMQSWINLAWFLLDAVIIVTYVKYGKSDFSKQYDGRFFIPWTLLAFIMAFAVQLAFIDEFGGMGQGYSAFLQNLLMSVLFISMFALRKGGRGQDLVIAVGKWIGTLAPTVLFGVIHYNFLILILGGFCTVFDIAYILLLMLGKTRFESAAAKNLMSN
jgi:hypothetical protein